MNLVQQFVRSTISDVTHLFFPHTCAGCGSDILSEHQLVCIQCADQLPVTNFHLHASNPVEKIFWGRIPVVSAASFYFFTKDSVLQHLLHQLKYGGKEEIGVYLGKLMGEGFKSSNRFRTFDVIIPLPLSPDKHRARGYNQAAAIAQGISDALDIPVLNKAVQRIRKTETQTFKNRIERWENIQGKFGVYQSADLIDKHILLVDDVITTGATLEACGSVILQEPGTSLSIATIAYTSL